MKPTIESIKALLEALQGDIDDDMLASEWDDTPGMCVTIATDDNLSDWDYQTGDNSFSGGCYRFPHWSVFHLYRDSDCEELARQALEELEDMIAS